MPNILLKNLILDSVPRDIIISDGIIRRILPLTPTQELFSDASLSEYLGPSIEVEVFDCHGKTAFPGFYNMHTHAAMTLFRGAHEDVPFVEWLDNIWEMERGIDSELIYWGTKVACLEMIRTGTIAFNDMYWFQRDAHRACEEMGMSPVLSYVILDRFDPELAEKQKAECEQIYEESLAWKDGTTFAISVHATYTVGENTILWASDFAKKNLLPLHFHLSETQWEVDKCKADHGGLTPVEYLDSLGVLDKRCIAAHSLWLTEKDIEILGRRGVTCVHNVNSNLKLTSGYRFLAKELRDAGVNLCIGTDGCASSNNLDILEAMKTSAMLQKGWRGDSTAMPLSELVDMATVNAANALGRNSGKIEEGRDADILLVDTDNTFFLSNGSFLANFIYSAHSDCIDSVISRGRFLMKNHRIEGEKEILAQARKILEKFS